jgi:hypothetical protein
MAWLVAACAIAHGASPPAAAAPHPQLHYTMASYKFDVQDPDRNPDDRSMARSVEWRYPVFAHTRDRATDALNAWLRQWAVRLLVGDGPLAQQAAHLTDRELIAKASIDPDFIDNGIGQVAIQPGRALGRYRSFVAYEESTGGVHPVHGVDYSLYDLATRGPRAVADLFKPGSEDTLSELYDAQKRNGSNPCEFREFGWPGAQLADADTLAFEYPYEPGQGVDCDVILVKAPQVARLLRSPRSLRPVFDVVEDKP